MDYGILIDTLECAVTWENLPKVHEEVRAVIKARPRTDLHDSSIACLSAGR